MSISEVWRYFRDYLFGDCAELPVIQVYGEFSELHMWCMSKHWSDRAKGCGKTQLSHTMSVVAQVP